jgi:beta-glucosidase
VVQVYASAPEGRLEKPDEVLVAFGKTGLLEPGQSETLTFTIDASVLSSFDEENSSWLAEAGTYTLKFGASSRDIREEASFTMDKDITAGTVSRALVPQQEIATFHK